MPNHSMPSLPPGARPTIALAMKYPDSEGNVWAWLTRVYEQLAIVLRGQGVETVLAHPALTDHPAVATPELSRQAIGLDRRGDAAAMRQWLMANNVRVVVYADVEPSLVDLRLLGRLGIKSVNYVHYNFSLEHPPALVKRWVNRLRGRLGICHHDLYLAVSRSNEMFLGQHAGIPSEKIRWIPNGVDTQRFAPSAGREARGVLAVCQARAEKRIDLLIDAAAELKSQPKNAAMRFVYVGDGGMMPAWRARVAERQLVQSFEMAGKQSDVRPYFQAAGMMVHPSQREGLCLAILEAMASGLPVIARRIEANQESIVDGQTGLLVSGDDPADWAAAIASLWNDPLRAQAMGAAARQRIVRHFSLDRQVRQLAQVLLELIR